MLLKDCIVTQAVDIPVHCMQVQYSSTAIFVVNNNNIIQRLH